MEAALQNSPGMLLGREKGPSQRGIEAMKYGERERGSAQ
jgi:hypothetical protein